MHKQFWEANDKVAAREMSLPGLVAWCVVIYVIGAAMLAALWIFGR
jgi:hypothetical protein